MTHQFNLNRPPHLIANEVLRQLEPLLSENGTHVRLEGRFHDLIAGLIEQYQVKLCDQLPVQQSYQEQQTAEEESEAWLRSLLASVRFPAIEDVYVAATKGYFYVTFAALLTPEQIKYAGSVLQLRIEKREPLRNRYAVVFEHLDTDEE